MNRIALLTFALAAAATSAVAVAQQPIPSARTHHASMDANHDGVIDRAEAATNPRFAARFDQLDKNHDGRLAADERPQWGGHGGHHGSDGIARMDANGDGRIARDEMLVETPGMFGFALRTHARVVGGQFAAHQVAILVAVDLGELRGKPFVVLVVAGDFFARDAAVPIGVHACNAATTVVAAMATPMRALIGGQATIMVPVEMVETGCETGIGGGFGAIDDAIVVRIHGGVVGACRWNRLLRDGDGGCRSSGERESEQGNAIHVVLRARRA